MESDGGSRSFIVAGATIPARPLEPGLYVVATPIGNLGDVTIRALETLAAADVIACEDTRTTRVLLDRYGIRGKLVAYHEHNESTAAARLIGAVLAGKSVAQVSDAGTPLVSDPGYRLVGQAIDAGVRVVPIPGPSALLAALAVSGLPSDAFFFAGFLPSKDGQRRTRLEALRTVPGTLIVYESPRRLADTLAAMADVLGPRPAAIGRELTKAFEEVRRGALTALAGHYADTDTPKGEIVICIAPPPDDVAADGDVDAVLMSLAGEMPASKAAGEAARMTGRPKAELYRRLVELKGRDGG
ncbi:MAG: 16S rRNA (cytidine(1402)-2'-O)-methyltransferase [Rhizobiaceae bacterium]|nr:16S rRNA (cytidine(1402)-2'-O)-methyltransferase [Rhizobiaceae bacterium]